jgi:hypothetical protein
MLWLFSTTCATSAWALSDICCDACIEECADDHIVSPSPRKERRKFLPADSDEPPPSPVRSRGRPSTMDDVIAYPRAKLKHGADRSCGINGDSIASRLCRGRANSTRHLFVSPSRPTATILPKPAGLGKTPPSPSPHVTFGNVSTADCHQAPITPGLVGRITSEQNAIVCRSRSRRCPP